MRAVLLIHERMLFADGHLIEIKVWRVPRRVHPSHHGLKYSLYYGRPGVRILGYDNERGKGDHRHFRGNEAPYKFITIEKLLADFKADIEVVRKETI